MGAKKDPTQWISNDDDAVEGETWEMWRLASLSLYIFGTRTPVPQIWWLISPVKG
jgi:hypothetical protein